MYVHIYIYYVCKYIYILVGNYRIWSCCSSKIIPCSSRSHPLNSFAQGIPSFLTSILNSLQISNISNYVKQSCDWDTQQTQLVVPLVRKVSREYGHNHCSDRSSQQQFNTVSSWKYCLIRMRPSTT